MKMIKSIAGIFLFTCLVTIRPAQTYDTVSSEQPQQGQYAEVRAKLVVLFQKAQQSAALLEVNPSNEKERKLIGKLANDLKNIEAQAQQNGLDDGVEEIRSVIHSLPKQPKKRKREIPFASSSEPEKIDVSQLPPLPLQLNTFDPQLPLPHQGKSLKKCVAGLLTYFPYEVSPMRGMIQSSNGSLRKQWQLAYESGSTVSRLMKKLFNYQDGQIVKTHLGGNPVMGLSPEIIGQLVRIMVLDPALLLRLDAAFFENWHACYRDTSMPEANRQLKKYEQHFKKEAENFLKILKQSVADESSKQAAIDLLLSYMMMSVEDAGVVVSAYANGLGIPFEALYYTDQDYEQAKHDLSTMSFSSETVEPYLEQLHFVASMQTGLRSYLTGDSAYVTYQGKTFPACKEIVLKKLVSLMLYNPDTGQLDLNMLPETIRNTVSEELRQFVVRYGCRAADDAEGVEAFLALVEDKAVYGICYAHNSYEITGSIGNCIAALQMLFGIQDHLEGSASRQFEQILQLLFNNGRRTISLDDNGPDSLLENQEDGWKFIIRNGGDDNDFIRMTVNWDNSGHASVAFVLPGDTYAQQLVGNLYYAGQVLDIFLLGVYDMLLPRILYHLQDEYIVESKEDFVDFFTIYSSQFGKKIPQAFNATGAAWKFFFENSLDEVSMHAIEAALEMGVDTDLENEGLLQEAFLVFCNDKDMEGVEKILEWGTNPPGYWLLHIGWSEFSYEQKGDLVEKLLQKGLFQDDVYATLEFLDEETVGLLPDKGPLGINRCDDQGNSLMMLALMHYDFEEFGLLFGQGADVNILNFESKSLCQLVVEDAFRMEQLLTEPITAREYQKKPADGSGHSIKYKVEGLRVVMEMIIEAPEGEFESDELELIRQAYEKFSAVYADFEQKVLHSLPS